MVLLFHTGPGLTRPTNFSRIKTTGKHSIEGSANRKASGRYAVLFCTTSKEDGSYVFCKVKPREENQQHCNSSPDDVVLNLLLRRNVM